MFPVFASACNGSRTPSRSQRLLKRLEVTPTTPRASPTPTASPNASTSCCCCAAIPPSKDKSTRFLPSNLGFRTSLSTSYCGPTRRPTSTPLLPNLLQHLNYLQLELQRPEATRTSKIPHPPFYPRKTASSSFDRVEGSRRRGTLKFGPKTVQG